MGNIRQIPGTAADPASSIAGTLPGASASNQLVRDLLPDSIAVERSESEWLLTLLSAEELRYIFEGPTDGKTQD